ncbi:hypothetical protein Bca52824_092592 [Brassica carinata]|uniref:Small ribosomal subunit protein uS5 C-terminal domain-containing protein n=1 Tax=Brassica carinata TaxID=52824 RepID=A0A8X7TF95_BRACI|nr:hypothetical protein Bca52824_092592 [Brassica carinata]
MAERGGERGAGDRGGFGRGFGGGRGDRGGRGGPRGRGNRRGGRPAEEEKWTPVTKLGRLVKEGKIQKLEQIYLHSLPVKEYQIIDLLVGPTLKDEVMKIMPVQKQTRAVLKGGGHGDQRGIILAKLSVIPVVGNKIGKPHTVPCKVTGKCGSVTVRMVPAPRGAGIVAARVPKKVLQFAGIDDVFTSSRGSTKTLGNFVKGVKLQEVALMDMIIILMECSNPAFVNAWKKACSSSGAVNLLVPEGKTYFLKSIRLNGPCKSILTVQIFGTLSASQKRSDYKDITKWITFDGLNSLSVDGGATGTVNGNGETWWQNSCKRNEAKVCLHDYILYMQALTFYSSKNLRVNNLRVRNAQQIQISIEKCSNVQVSNVEVTAPADSPNTDGIHITNSQNIQVSKTVIGTGDDCISIETGSQNVNINDLTCGPGHGISIGSLGDDNSKAFVSGVTVDGAKLSGTDNGLRIKTYQGGSGTASDIIFQNIQMDNTSAVQVKNVVYRNISGTSASDIAITLNCSKNYPCQGIVLDKVNIKGGKGSCSNANVMDKGIVFPQCKST